MKKILQLSLVASILLAVQVSAQEAPSASEVLERAIAYHDPKGLWDRARFELQIRETGPGHRDRHTRVRIDTPGNAFELLTQREGRVIEGLMADDECVLTLDGALDFTDEERDEYRLTCDRLRWLRDYYTYLWGQPMKLRDPGTLIDPRAEAAEYQGLPAWSLRVTYDEAVGTDTWYFYFDKESYALIGYRFYHNEADNDGEYIVLAGEIEADGMKIPARRAWYTHADDRHLGDDVLTAIEIVER
jgi:hypothetical protein